jgi:hypothetical protein
MFRHRFRHTMTSPPPPAFVVVPLGWLPPVAPAQWAYVQALYQLAFAQAEQVVRPSIVERDLLGVWN